MEMTSVLDLPYKSEKLAPLQCKCRVNVHFPTNAAALFWALLNIHSLLIKKIVISLTFPNKKLQGTL